MKEEELSALVARVQAKLSRSLILTLRKPRTYLLAHFTVHISLPLGLFPMPVFLAELKSFSLLLPPPTPPFK